MFDDDPFLKVKPGAPPAPAAADADVVARGEGWRLVRGGGRPVLHFQSGGLMGRSERLEVSEAEAEELTVSGEGAADRILARHGVG